MSIEKAKEKIVENTAANLLCFLIDNYENTPLNENQLQQIGVEFLKSRYNQPLAELPAEPEPTELIEKIKDALADPKAPWYGSDLVEWIVELIDEIDRLTVENNSCPECGKHNIEIFVDKINFGTIDIYVPIQRCKDCSFSWTDDIAGEVYDKNKSIIDHLTDENNLQITIDMLIDKDEQTRIGINPNDVEHKRDNNQLLVQILGEYNERADRIHDLEEENGRYFAEIQQLKADNKRLQRIIKLDEQIENNLKGESNG